MIDLDFHLHSCKISQNILKESTLKKGLLSVELMSRGYAWLDTGTYDSLLEASNFIKTIESRQGLKISCIEEIAYKYGYIDKDLLEENAKKYNNEYGAYLMSLIK